MGKHDAFERIFKSFPPHKKQWLLSAPNKSEHSFCDGAAPREGLLRQHAQSLYCLRTFTGEKTKQKASDPAALWAWGRLEVARGRGATRAAATGVPFAGAHGARSAQPSSQLPGCLWILHKALFLWHIYKAHARCTSPPGWRHLSPCQPGRERAVYCSVPSSCSSLCTCLGG